MTESPLSSRVPSPSVLELPASPGLEWRAATEADIDALFDCASEIDAADHPHYTTPRDEFEEQFEVSYVDPALDSLIAIEPDGRVVAFGFTTLSPGQDTLVRSILWGGVRPSARGRGLGAQLLAWQEGRALQQLAASEKLLPGWVMTFTEQNNEAAVRLLTRAGFEIKRYYLELRRDVAQPIARRELAEGLTLAPLTPDLDDEVLAARNDAFRDHWGSQPVTDEQWRTFVGSPRFRRDLSFVALSAGGEVAGFTATTVNEDDWPGQGFSSGYIDLVGVRRGWRGKGIAPAVLARTLEAIRDAGLERAVLDVDAENPSGALGLYEGVGFEEAHRSLNLLKEF